MATTKPLKSYAVREDIPGQIPKNMTQITFAIGDGIYQLSDALIVPQGRWRSPMMQDEIDAMINARYAEHVARIDAMLAAQE